MGRSSGNQGEMVMKRLMFLGCATAALVLAAGIAAPAAATVAQSAETLRVQPLRYHYRQLANGLRVYAMPDPNTANVAIQVWYRVGSRDDPQGRSGFAHLFEHMLFKSTRNMPDGMFQQLTADVGGTYNASTHADYTDYFEVAPANHLERLLWMEAERMGSLVVDPAALESETDVVKEELRQRVLASPYGRLFYFYLSQANFARHPYGRPGIGSMEDLESASIEDVRAFHAAYYRPDNAIMVVAGNFDLDQFNQWVDRYFSPIARPDRPIPRVEVSEPPRTAPRTFDTYAPNVPLPAVLANYIHPGASSPDVHILYVIDALLQQGQSSRLYRSLVYDQQLATQILTNWEPNLDPGAFTVGAILSAGHSVEEGERALLAELARLRNEPVTPAELEEAKNELVTSTLQQRETAYGRSLELATAVLSYGDPAAADRMLAQVQNVTAADVQRVARLLFDENRRVVIRYQSEENRPAGQTGDTIETSPDIAEQALTIPPDVPVYTLAAPAERVAPPAPAAPVAARIPQIGERTLANGLRVIVAPQPTVPLISAELRVGAGSAAEPQGRSGTAILTAALLSKGTATRTASQISSEVESLGASLNIGASADYSQATLQTRSDRIEPAFDILADVVRNPALAQEELDRIRQLSLDGLSVAMRQPGGIASMVVNRAIYGSAPYGSTPSPASLAAITRDDVARFHSQAWRPDNAVLVLAGDITPDQGFALAERHFGHWTAPAAARRPSADVAAWAPAARTIVVDLPQTGQAAVQMGIRGISRRDEDYFDTLLANAVFGGGSAGRLNMEIRERRGLSYGAYSQLTPLIGGGPIIAQTQTRNDAAVQVVGLMETELRRIRDTITPAEELEARKASIIGSFGRSVEVTAGLAAQISNLAFGGLPPQSLSTYVADLMRVTAEDVQAAARRHFDPARVDLVVVGDAQLFYDDLLRVRPDAERIPVSELNLDTEALR